MTDSWLSHVVKAMHANPGEKFEVMLKKAVTTPGIKRAKIIRFLRRRDVGVETKTKVENANNFIIQVIFF